MNRDQLSSEHKRVWRTARWLMSDHTSHADRRDNCGACALATYTADSAPDYAGWLRVYIQAGQPVPRQHYDSEVAYAAAENPAYHGAILADVETFGITFI